MQRYTAYLLVTVGIVVVAVAAVLGTGTSPQLGLDLQGGISVVLAPTGHVRSDSVAKAVDIIRSRVDALGVAEPQISQQGSNVVIDLPGVRDTNRARKLVGTTAQLRFRPVLRALPAYDSTAGTPTGAPLSSTTTTVTSTTGATGTPAPSSTTTTTRPRDPSAAIPSSTTDDPTQQVVLPTKPNSKEPPRYLLGPSQADGKALSGAKASFDTGSGGWIIDFTLSGSGNKTFNAMAAANVGKQVAIELDGVVQSAPTIKQASFPGTGQITGSFTEKEAKDLALVLRYGALPVQLKEQTVQAVSPTLGRDQLRSGVIAGLIGLAIVALYMLVYYRLLGMVVWAGLLMSAGALYALTSWLGHSIGLTLTLAGVTGIIVSVGVTVDSYVVYFERLKDEVRSGKTIRSSLDRGFSRSFRTILAADLVSLIAAVLLYLLAVGSVRGFAFFLGLSTLLDIIVAYFFMHPLVSIIGRRPTFTQAGWLGVAKGLDAEGVTT